MIVGINSNIVKKIAAPQAPRNDSNDTDIQAIKKFDSKLQDSFISFGELLATVKRTGEFKKKGYKSFKDFIEKEYNISSSFAKKLIDLYDLYVDELDLLSEDVSSIGMDRLNLIKTIVRESEINIADEWIEKAKIMSYPDLKELVYEEREKNKKPKTFKEILIEQFYERFCVGMNCSVKELIYKLAVYFHDMTEAEFTELNTEIKHKTRQLTDEMMMKGERENG